MGPIQVIMDCIMCILWATTYTLVLIATVKYRYPAISPITQLIVAPLEFAVLILYIFDKSFGASIPCLSYLFWSAIEIVIFAVIIRSGFIRREKVPWYLLGMVIMTAIMVFFVVVQKQVLFFTHFNTLVGELFWLRFAMQKAYPMKPVHLTLFVTKFFADILVVFVYFRLGTWGVQIMCVALPVLDSLFITAYWEKTKRKSKQRH